MAKKTKHAHEQELIRKAQRGNADACRELIDSHRDRLYAFVWRMVRNHHDAEDVCQEAFLKAFSALDTFETKYRFSTWLFTIGYRLCLNRIKGNKKSASSVDLSLFSDGSASTADQVADDEQARKLKQQIWQSVDTLSPSQRAVVLLFYKESMSCQQIGQVLQVPVATVKSHLHRARNRLRDSLESQVADDWDQLRFTGEQA